MDVTDIDIEIFKKTTDDIVISEDMYIKQIIHLCKLVQALEKTLKKEQTALVYYRAALEELELLYDDIKT
tara:strand:- start:890 stop:1099 length:210 start_codon:yes stop_codon:yes gene_type:complete